MKCQICKSDNPESARFCMECGNKLANECPACNQTYPPGIKFCPGCGYDLRQPAQAPRAHHPVFEAPAPDPLSSGKETPADTFDGERKYVTVLFSDISGYTEMAERLDPEEVKDFMNQIFAEITAIVSRYEGFIEKFIGDAVMALFGIPRAHEDDSVRAIRAAKEIHKLVRARSPQIEERIGRRLLMHSGINTGLVVTGEIDLEKGTHRILGDTINLASRLSNLSQEDEIIVGADTYRQAQGYYSFETLEPQPIKGIEKPVPIYKVLSAKEKPTKILRLHGVKADLIGRKAEMKKLMDAVERLRDNEGSVITICGSAGTGKSRLVEEFKNSLNPEDIQWFEGHAYPYSQKIPYSVLINLLSRAFQIEEGDTPDKIKTKVEDAISALAIETADPIPYIGSLFSLRYDKIKDVSPEYWKSQLQNSIQVILTTLAQRAPTIVCLEDLHWSDSSFLELIRHILSEFRDPVLFLCIYRPSISLFTSDQLKILANPYSEIRLEDLSLSESHDMIESLLKTETIPVELQSFVQDKIEGNPFYIEEVINSLIESETLIRNTHGWKITGSIDESVISSTIHGIISGRLDRLEKEMKRILQEASVIGRAFVYDILTKITNLREHIDRCLSGLERLDLIKTRSVQPYLEYIFKHALTQEVVYNGLLKKERKEIHERIGRVMEEVFQERLSEFYETLAFHFARGRSLDKAIDYLMNSGEKSLGRYALEEAHQYYQDAFELLDKKRELADEDIGRLVDIIIKWAFIYYYRGDFIGFINLFRAHEDLAASLDDKARLGMFNAWYGFALDMTGHARESYEKLNKALELGEEIGNQQVIGYACTWLTWTCWDLGLLDKAISFGERAQEIARTFESDHYLYFKSLAGIGQTCYSTGDRKRAIQAGTAILEHGQKNSNIRSMTLGHICIAYGHLLSGDFQAAIETGQKALQISADPFYSQYVRVQLGFSYLLNNQFQEAEKALQEVLDYSQKYNAQILGLYAKPFLGVTYIAKGRSSLGLKMIEESILASADNGRKTVYAILEYTLGKVYFQLAAREAPIDIAFIAKNIGFLAKNLLIASRKAEAHFNKAMEVAQEAGANGVLGQIYLDLGLLQKFRGKKEKVREHISKALQIFEEMDAKRFVQQAREVLDSLE